jgi:epoxyqueuosine reductase
MKDKDMPVNIKKQTENHNGLKEEIIGYVTEKEADLVGFASAVTWDKIGEVPSDFRPGAIWEEAKTVIVLGIAMLLPILETTPSILHTEMYNTCNRELDSLAFNLARYLNRRGHASIFFPRDAYGSIEIIKQNPRAAFDHRTAAKYAGLGTIGLSHNLLTPEFGPRVRFVSVFTSAEIMPGKIMEKELCIKCLACAQCCPVNALSPAAGELIAGYNVMACTDEAARLTQKRSYPCGICIKVCPIGEDRKLFKESGIIKKYREEKEALAKNPDDPEYQSWIHARRYGRWT